jgi:N-methylhydantoinase B/oxoprolinase/acetone carboxylase alpha subunit
MNTPEPSTISRDALRVRSTTPHLPSNEGFFRALRIVIPDGSFLPRRCAMWPTPSTTIPTSS